MESLRADAAQDTRARGGASLRRVAILFLLSIPAAAATLWDEILLAGPIVFLVEILGFALGLVVFILIWAALGLGAMAAIDYVWPHVARFLDPLIARFTGTPDNGESPSRGGWFPLLALLAAGGVLAGAGVTVSLAGSQVKDWSTNHWSDVGMFFVAAVVIFVILVIVDRLSHGLETWVRSIADTAGPALRSFAALVTMVVLGPVLGWAVFRLLGYSRRSTYALTLVAAPVFGGIWVPFYSLGIWGPLQAWL